MFEFQVALFEAFQVSYQFILFILWSSSLFEWIVFFFRKIENLDFSLNFEDIFKNIDDFFSKENISSICDRNCKTFTEKHFCDCETFNFSRGKPIFAENMLFWRMLPSNFDISWMSAGGDKPCWQSSPNL